MINCCMLFCGSTAKRCMDHLRGPPRGFGQQGKKAIYFREQGNKRPKLKGRGEQRQYLGKGSIENQDFDFGEQGKCRFVFQGNKGKGTHPGRASFDKNCDFC